MRRNTALVSRVGADVGASGVRRSGDTGEEAQMNASASTVNLNTASQGKSSDWTSRRGRCASRVSTRFLLLVRGKVPDPMICSLGREDPRCKDERNINANINNHLTTTSHR